MIENSPIANNLEDDLLKSLIKIYNINYNDAVFFICDEYDKATRFGSIVINKIGSDLKLINQMSLIFVG